MKLHINQQIRVGQLMLSCVLLLSLLAHTTTQAHSAFSATRGLLNPLVVTPVRVGLRSAWKGRRKQLPSVQNCAQPSDYENLIIDASEVSDEKDINKATANLLYRSSENDGEQCAEYAYLKWQGSVHSVAPCIALSQTSKTSLPGKKSNFSDRSKSSASSEVKSSSGSFSSSSGRSGHKSQLGVDPRRPLMFWENMICGAVSRSVAQTMLHPANTMKTLLQRSAANSGLPKYTFRSLCTPQNFPMLWNGAGAAFALSIPQGAVNFAVLEFVRMKMEKLVDRSPSLRERKDRLAPAMDFTSSSISTLCCSVVATPQMMITDNIMAGNYKDLPTAVRGLWARQGIRGFYKGGWFPGLVGKIPSYALTWTLFRQLKEMHYHVTDRAASNIENSAMGCLASATSVSVMIPMDTIKTRLVTQAGSMTTTPYKGIIDCAVRVAREEGIGAFYKGLPPRLISVVPMVGIQFAVYEFMKRTMRLRTVQTSNPSQPYYKVVQKASLSNSHQSSSPKVLKHLSIIEPVEGDCVTEESSVTSI